MRRKLCVAFAVLVLLSLAGADVFAGGFLKYDGIEGESTDKNHQGWIDVLAWKWKKAKVEQVGRGGCGRVEQSDLVITKDLDTTTPEFLRLVDQCAREPEVILDVALPVRPGDDAGVQRFMRITMMDVRVTRVAMKSDGSSDRVLENVAFNFREIEFEEIVLDGAT